MALVTNLRRDWTINVGHIHMDASTLLAMKRSAISSLGFPVTMLDQSLAQADPNTFLLLSKFGLDFILLPEPDIAALVWATSVGAMRRIVKFEIEGDDGIVLAPPSAFTFGISPTYVELLKYCKAKWPSATMETASYRIASDGKFISREIETPDVSFYFRNPADQSDESPFVVKHKLKAN